MLVYLPKECVCALAYRAGAVAGPLPGSIVTLKPAVRGGRPHSWL